MTPKELRAEIVKVDKMIATLEATRANHMSALCAFFAKFNVGDVVNDGRREYVITNRSLWSENSTDVHYSGKRLKLDGTPHNQRPGSLWGALTLMRRGGAP